MQSWMNEKGKKEFLFVERLKQYIHNYFGIRKTGLEKDKQINQEIWWTGLMAHKSRIYEHEVRKLGTYQSTLKFYEWSLLKFYARKYNKKT